MKFVDGSMAFFTLFHFESCTLDNLTELLVYNDGELVPNIEILEIVGWDRLAFSCAVFGSMLQDASLDRAVSTHKATDVSLFSIGKWYCNDTAFRCRSGYFNSTLITPASLVENSFSSLLLFIGVDISCWDGVAGGTSSLFNIAVSPERCTRIFC